MFVAGARPQELVGGAAYAAPRVSVEDHRAYLATLGCDRGVLVQPSAYGTDDHRVLLSALRARPDHLRGVACVPVGTPRETLEQMHEAGVRATRVQDGFPGGVPVTAIEQVARMVAPLGWHIEVWTDLRRHLPWFEAVVRNLEVDVVIDHLGYLPSDVGLADPAMRMLARMIERGNTWVTLSGSERLVPPGAGWAAHEDRIAERVASLVQLAPEHLLWGTDWPHVGLAEPHPVPGELLARLERWVPDPGVREQVTTRNPATRYDFAAG